VKVESRDGVFVEDVCLYKHLSDAVSAMPDVFKKYKLMAVDVGRVYDTADKKMVLVYQQDFMAYRKLER
jgi:hypothetical protein